MMSRGNFSSTSSLSEENSCVKKDSLHVKTLGERGDASSYTDTKRKKSSSRPDRSITDRVLKGVGSTSTSFIGPACRPQKVKVKPNIDETLIEFYKELETISTDGTYAGPVQDAGAFKSRKRLKTPARKESDTSGEKDGVMTRPLDKNAHQKSTGQKGPPHQNEPYHPKRQRTNFDPTSDGAGYPPHPQSHWQHHPPFQSKPYTRFHQTPHRVPPPPFPSAFPGPPPDLAPRVNHNWSYSDRTNQYQDDLNFPHIHRFPPPPPRHFKDFDGDPSYHFDREEGGYDYDDSKSNNVNVGWSNNGNGGWFQPCEDVDWRQRFHTENEPRAREDRSRPPDGTCAPDPSLVLILMRGAPGSGKSSFAQELLSTGPNGLVLSTDDYFCHDDGYFFDPNVLGLAHEWNQNRAKEAMYKGRSPVIVDNTNTQAWEMKPYVKLALERGYNVCFQEPNTSWKFDPFELEKRTKHGVPQEKIAQMLDRFSFPISVDIVMSSQEPPHVNTRHHPEQQQHQKSNNPDVH